MLINVNSQMHGSNSARHIDEIFSSSDKMKVTTSSILPHAFAFTPVTQKLRSVINHHRIVHVQHWNSRNNITSADTENYKKERQ